MWNEVVANIKDFFNQPVVIIVASVFAVIVFALVIFSKTSLGKRKLNNLKERCNKLEEGYETFKSDASKKIEESEEFYKKEKEIIENKVATLEKVCLIIAENSHNEKIKSAVEKYKNELSICKTNYEVLIEDRIKAEKDKFVEEYHKKYDELYEHEFKAVKDKLDELVDKAEKASQNVQNKAKTAIEELEETSEQIKEVIENEREETIDVTREEEKTE